jgi:hypothetical protein
MKRIFFGCGGVGVLAVVCAMREVRARSRMRKVDLVGIVNMEVGLRCY